MDILFGREFQKFGQQPEPQITSCERAKETRIMYFVTNFIDEKIDDHRATVVEPAPHDVCELSRPLGISLHARTSLCLNPFLFFLLGVFSGVPFVTLKQFINPSRCKYEANKYRPFPTWLTTGTIRMIKANEKNAPVEINAVHLGNATRVRSTG